MRAPHPYGEREQDQLRPLYVPQQRQTSFFMGKLQVYILTPVSESKLMRSSAVSVVALLALGVALVRADYGYSTGGGYDQSGYSTGYAGGYDQSGYGGGYGGGYVGGYSGGYDAGYGYSTGMGGYGAGMSGYGHSGYGSGYGHKKSKTSVYVPVPVPVQTPVNPLPAPLPLDLALGDNTQDQGIFGGNGALLLGLLALTPILLNNNNSG
uniref:Uncharacterized protein F12A10.7-like n=1 Tax=Crassostrea virginica TaxID=6565 RepID=A0A8B8AIV2_CRAVI|nr:uncharacterized protein F12A10.7-like [Crassostrea virginica]